MLHLACALSQFSLRHWLTVMLLGFASSAFSAPDSEPQVEAAYLVNFMKYIDWPTNNRTTTTICLFGRDTLGSFLAGYEGRSVGGRELRIRRANSPDDISNCQLVYIPDVEEARVGVVLRWLQNTPVLAASNVDGFARAGGGIELVRGTGRVQFIVNVEALSRNGLTPSSQMLRLAQKVIGVER